MKDVNPNGTNAPRRVTVANVKIPLKTGPKKVFMGRKFWPGQKSRDKSIREHSHLEEIRVVNSVKGVKYAADGRFRDTTKNV